VNSIVFTPFPSADWKGNIPNFLSGTTTPGKGKIENFWRKTLRRFQWGFGCSQQAKNGSGYPLPMLAKKEINLCKKTIKRKNARLNISPTGQITL